MEIRITYKNIRHGIKSMTTNDAFTDNILSILTEKKNRQLNLKGIMDVIKGTAYTPFTIEELEKIEREIKLDAIIDNGIYSTPDGEIH